MRPRHVASQPGDSAPAREMRCGRAPSARGPRRTAHASRVMSASSAPQDAADRPGRSRCSRKPHEHDERQLQADGQRRVAQHGPCPGPGTGRVSTRHPGSPERQQSAGCRCHQRRGAGAAQRQPGAQGHERQGPETRSSVDRAAVAAGGPSHVARRHPRQRPSFGAPSETADIQDLQVSVVIDPVRARQRRPTCRARRRASAPSRDRP